MLRDKKANILLVDDIPANILALRAVLNSPQYQLVEASSGFEAVKWCNEREFALVVLDVQMPGMDGFETAKRIKESRFNKDVPIVFVTAYFQADPYVKKGYEAGAIDYFGKPFDTDILKAKVGIYTELYLKTKRIQETEQLLRTHGHLKTLLESIPVGIIIANGDGQITEYNEEASKIWGGGRQLIDDINEAQIWWAESGKPASPQEWGLAHVLATEQHSENERLVIEMFDGTKKTISNSSFPIKADDGGLLGAFSVIQDISARKELFQDIHKAVEILRDANAPTHHPQ